MARIPQQQQFAAAQHQAAEGERLRQLAGDRKRYDTECEERQRGVDEENRRLDDLIARLAAGESEAVDEYVGIVFGNSIYPEVIAAHCDIDFSYSAEFRELSITLVFPAARRHPGDQVLPVCARR